SPPAHPHYPYSCSFVVRYDRLSRYSLFPVSFLQLLFFFFRPPPRPTLFPYTTLFRSAPSTARSCAAWARRSSTPSATWPSAWPRSEEHTSELQSRFDLVCRLLLEKKKRHVIFAVAEPGMLVFDPSPRLPT